MPPSLKPESARAEARDIWWTDIIRHWDLVLSDLTRIYRLDLHDPAVLDRPWPGVRARILGLLKEPSRLRDALTQEVKNGPHGRTP